MSYGQALNKATGTSPWARAAGAVGSAVKSAFTGKRDRGTPNQAAINTMASNNFIEKTANQIATNLSSSVKSGLVSPTPTTAGGPTIGSSVESYVSKFLGNASKVPQTQQQIKNLANQVQATYAKDGGKQAIDKLAHLVFATMHDATPSSAGTQAPEAPAAQPAAPAAQPAAPGTDVARQGNAAQGSANPGADAFGKMAQDLNQRTRAANAQQQGQSQQQGQPQQPGQQQAQAAQAARRKKFDTSNATDVNPRMPTRPGLPAPTRALPAPPRGLPAPAAKVAPAAAAPNYGQQTNYGKTTMNAPTRVPGVSQATPGTNFAQQANYGKTAMNVPSAVPNPAALSKLAPVAATLGRMPMAFKENKEVRLWGKSNESK